MFDRGKNVTECLWLLYKLETEAERAGGKVHFILGNHDIMNLISDLRYVHSRYFSNAKLLEENYADLYAVDSELGRWLRTKNTIEKIGDYIFVHGGVNLEIANANLSLTEMNNIVRNCIDKTIADNDCNLLSRLYWYRGLVYQQVSEPQLDTMLSQLNCSKIIVGHTIVDKITGLYNDKVVAIDIDHDENTQNGIMYALLIDQNKFYIINHNANTEFLFDGIELGITSQTNLVKGYSLLPSYPNPFNRETIIQYHIPNTINGNVEVNIDIFNIKGQMVRSLIHELNSPGIHRVTWNGLDDFGVPISTGVYVYHMHAGSFVASKKMTIIK